ASWMTFGSPAIVNAYYSPLANSINIPAGILQGKFFASDLPKFWNYGSMGTVIGHEITHGFDDVGRQFDSKGTRRRFIRRTKCLIHEYDAFKNPNVNMTVNGGDGPWRKHRRQRRHEDRL
ncbi:Membrane metalloendopeptidaselike 1like, partial [Caligus rogercresseyi]